jgi:quinol monooxygenase YgiN
MSGAAAHLIARRSASRRECGRRPRGERRDPRLFYIHSRWKDETAFEHHADLPHTIRFVARVEPLIDHPLDVRAPSESARARAGDAGRRPMPL